MYYWSAYARVGAAALLIGVLWLIAFWAASGSYTQ